MSCDLKILWKISTVYEQIFNLMRRLDDKKNL